MPVWIVLLALASIIATLALSWLFWRWDRSE
jgi:hypothetical protein